MITAEEYLNKNHFHIVLDIKDTGLYPGDITNVMIEFAKLHVEAALKKIADDYIYYLEGDEGSERLNEKRFFKKAYPLTNIK